MPEYPDIEVYKDALAIRLAGHQLRRIRLGSPFVLRSVEPPLSATTDLEVTGLRRLGKRICIGLEKELWLVIHLMVGGRLLWNESNAVLPKRRGLLALDFDNGSLLMTEAGTKKRASLHLVKGEEGLQALDPGGLDFMSIGAREFAQQLTRRNHTLKRALTDPRLFSGIGNAYSDEILHRGCLSPVTLTQSMNAQQIEALRTACIAVMDEWRERLQEECGDGFPRKVTAFRKEMAVHGKYGQPCPRCGTQVQRIVYASNETNYCPRCQTGGKLLKDRALSQLLKKDWPKCIDDLEERANG